MPCIPVGSLVVCTTTGDVKTVMLVSVRVLLCVVVVVVELTRIEVDVKKPETVCPT